MMLMASSQILMNSALMLFLYLLMALIISFFSLKFGLSLIASSTLSYALRLFIKFL